MLKVHQLNSQNGSNPGLVRNLNTGKVLVSYLHVADTFWSRLTGLTPTRSLPQGHGLLLTPCSSVHTLFMKYSIDVAYLNSNLTVVRAFPHIKPWRALPVVPGTKHVLEMPRGTLTDTQTQVGDRLEIRLAIKQQPIK